MGFVAAAGGEPIDCGNAPDTLEGTRAAFRRALDTGCELLVSTGGVSVGDFDVVKQALAEEGAEMRFWKVRMKPGKPLAFGVIGGRPAFGLPGNPVSCMVNFLQYVRPLIRKALRDPLPYLPVVDACLADPIRKRAGRNELCRVTLRWSEDGLLASSTGSQGSGMTTSMVLAHGFALLGPDSTGAAAGSTIPVQIIEGAFLAQATPGLRWQG
jgi:molybdopterin molybdotransferase